MLRLYVEHIKDPRGQCRDSPEGHGGYAYSDIKCAVKGIVRGFCPKSTTPPREIGGVIFMLGTAPQRGLPEGLHNPEGIYLPVPSGVKHG